MYIKTKKELDLLSNTIADGTKTNPFVHKLPWNYKIPLYLGYQVKWNYEYYYERSTEKPYNNIILYEIKPVIKKGASTFNCYWDYANWDFLMDVLLPQMEKDNLLIDKIRKQVLKFDRKQVTIECFNIIEKHVKDIDYPFVNIVDRFHKYREII